VRRRSIVVRHQGEEWERDLSRCRVIVVQRQMEGKFANVEELAAGIGLNPDTVYRWLRGVGPGAEETTARILKGLGVEFNDVHREVPMPPEGGGPVVPSR
jgi:DNA-binding phage protein